jgi:pimeloyl-[acyl-carrier protein] methyl ester esterase
MADPLLILLPGWGLGTAPLEPLAAALHGRGTHLQVRLADLPAGADPVACLEQLDASLPQDCWLGGWSLGGMLAAELAARRGARCAGLLTLASNACFVARADWSQAMAEETFAAFRANCAADAELTLKRFVLLCTQGAAATRQLSRQLVMGAPPVRPDALLAGLDLLATLDTRVALRTFAGPQLHLFAGADALVPVDAAEALRALSPDIRVGLFDAASHALPLERPHEVAKVIRAFLHEVGDD